MTSHYSIAEATAACNLHRSMTIQNLIPTFIGRFKITTLLSGLMLAALAFTGTSCSSTKVISFSNTKVASNAPVTNIVCIMVDPRGDIRASVEGHLAEQLNNSGVQAYASYTKFSLQELLGNKETERQDLSVWGADAVLLCKLTDRTDISEPSEFKANTADWREVWGGTTLSTEFEPNAWGGDVEVTVHLESKLYRLRDNQLLWAGYAKAKFGETTDYVKIIKAASRQIVSQLEKDGLIK